MHKCKETLKVDVRVGELERGATTGKAGMISIELTLKDETVYLNLPQISKRQ
jgi:hypothetical protein